MPTHPYPLYEALCEVLLLALLWLGRDSLARVPGVRFLSGAVGYAIIRFGLTFLRQESIVVWGLQEAQFIAAVTGGIALVLLVVRFRPALRPYSG